MDVQTAAVTQAAEDLCRLAAEVPDEDRDSWAGLIDTEGVVEEILVSFGERCFVLKAAGREPFTLNQDESALFCPFVHRMVRGVSTETVGWAEINRTVSIDTPERSSKQHPHQAKAWSSLNRRLGGWDFTKGGRSFRTPFLRGPREVPGPVVRDHGLIPPDPLGDAPLLEVLGMIEDRPSGRFRIG